MENLIKESEKLAHKQSHVRESFKKMLGFFAKATKENLKEEELKILPLGGFNEGNGSNQLFLIRGEPELYVIPPEKFMGRSATVAEMYKFNAYKVLDISKCDMKYIRTACEHIPGAIESHIEKIQAKQQADSKLVDLLSGLN